MRPDAVDPDAFNAFEAAGWNAAAPGYDRFFGSITSRMADSLLDAASVAARTRVLDVATGPGYGAGRAASRGASVISVDVAEAMVSLARRLHPELDFRQADAHSLPFEHASFDAVVGNFVILHLGRPEAAVAGFVRVLAPGGIIALTAWDLPIAHAFSACSSTLSQKPELRPRRTFPPARTYLRADPASAGRDTAADTRRVRPAARPSGGYVVARKSPRASASAACASSAM